MTFKHISFHESEIMRSLERDAARKGHFDPTEDELVAAASYKIKKANSLKPSDNLFSDLSVLAAELRERGYEDQASDLENKIADYKVAETHLYRVHEEDGEDVLDFAHPEGSVQVDEGNSPFGKVLSPNEKAKIIREVINQEPSGDLAIFAALVKKNAQATVDVTAIDSAKREALNSLQANVEASDGEPLYHFSTQRILNATDKSYLSFYSKLSGVPLDKIIKLKKIVSSIYGKKFFSPVAIVEKINATPQNRYEDLINLGNNLQGGLGDKYFSGTQPGLDKTLAESSLYAAMKPDNNSSIWVVKTIGALLGQLNKDSQQVTAAANAMHSVVQGLYNEVFGPLDDANEKLGSVLSKQVAPIRAIDTTKITSESLEAWAVGLQALLPGGKQYQYISLIAKAFNPDLADKFTEKVVALKNTLLESLRAADKEPDWWNAQVTATRYRKAADLWTRYANSLPEGSDKRTAADANAKLASSLANVVSNAVSLSSLQKGIASLINANLDSYYRIDQHSISALQFASQQTGLSASSSFKVEDLIKVAQAAPTGFSAVTKTSPATPVSSTSPPASKPRTITETPQPIVLAPKPSGGQAPTAQKPSAVAGRPTVEERQQVALMQNVLADFAKAISDPNEKTRLAQTLSNAKTGLQTTESNLQQWAGPMNDTGGKKTFDGKWSTLTRGGLDAVNVIINRAREAGLYNGNVVDIDGEWTKDKPEILIEKAQKNTKVIADVMNVLKLGKFMSQEVQSATGTKPEGSEVIYDQIPHDINRENLDPRKKGPVAIDPQSLKSLFDFYNFLSGQLTLTISASDNSVSGNGIVVLAQLGNPPVRPAGGMIPATIPAPQRDEDLSVALKQLNAGQFMYALKWMYERSRSTYSMLMAQKANPEYIAKARAYMDAMTNLIRQWNQISRNYKASSIIDPSVLPGSGAEGIRSPGAGRGAAFPKQDSEGGGRAGTGRMGPEGANVGGRPSSSEGGSPEDDAVEALRNPPLSDFINIATLTRYWGVPGAENYETMLVNPRLDLRQLRGAYVGRLYNRLLSEQAMEMFSRQAQKTETDPSYFLSVMFNKMSQDLNAVYTAWANQVMPFEDNPRVSGVVREQSKKLDQWMQVLSWLATSAATEARSRALRRR